MRILDPLNALICFKSLYHKNLVILLLALVQLISLEPFYPGIFNDGSAFWPKGDIFFLAGSILFQLAQPSIN